MDESHFLRKKKTQNEAVCFCCQGNNCNRYDTIQLLQPQSLFSIFVYLYLQRDFSPFTTTTVLIPLLLHNRKRSSVLVGLKVLGFLHTWCIHMQSALQLCLFWLIVLVGDEEAPEKPNSTSI